MNEKFKKDHTCVIVIAINVILRKKFFFAFNKLSFVITDAMSDDSHKKVAYSLSLIRKAGSQ